MSRSKRISTARQAIRNRIVAHSEEDPGKLIANPLNFRRHPDTQRAALRGSMKELGWIKSVLVNRTTGNVIDGHARCEEAKACGATVPVDWVEMTPEEERLALAVLDPITEMATRDDEVLGRLLADVQAQDEGLRQMLAELATSANVGATSGLLPGVDEDHVPEPPAEPVTKRGDVWLLGRHRLMCGDSGCVTDVERLMAGKTAALYATDPPYGVGYGDETGSDSAARFGKIANDENNGPKLQEFLTGVFTTWLAFLRADAAWYLWHAQLTQGYFAAAAAAAAAQLLVHRQIIWVKPSLILGHGDYHWRHELCFYGWREGHRARWLGDRKQTTVWEIGRERSGIHPTQKPVEIFERPIQFHTIPGDVIAEPFAGSGTQIIAAEKTNRSCYAMELDRVYCDVIVKRWENATGQKATLES